MTLQQDPMQPPNRVVFRGSGSHDAGTIHTATGEHVPSPVDHEARITYTVSYRGDTVAPQDSPSDIAEKLKDEAKKAIENEITTDRSLRN